jgi:hypothetical protein
MKMVMNAFARPFRLTSPYDMEPDADAIMSPYDSFEPDSPAEPEQSPYMAQNKAAIETALGAGTGRRGLNAYENEDALDAGPDEPGFIPASQVPGGYGGSYSAGGTQTPNPAGMAGGKSPASTPGHPNPYDDPPLGGDGGPILDPEDVPRNETDSPYEKHVSPEWASVARIDEEIAAMKREEGSLGGILGGVFRNRAAGAQNEAGMRSLLAERGQLVAQAQWADNRRSSEMTGKTVDVVEGDGKTRRYALTRGGQKIPLGIAPKSRAELESEAKAEAGKDKADAMASWYSKGTGPLNEQGEAVYFDRAAKSVKPLMETATVEAQGPMPAGLPAGYGVEAERPFKPKTPKTKSTNIVGQPIPDDEGNITVIREDPATGKLTAERLGGFGKKTKPSATGDPSDKILAAAKSAEERARASHRTNPMNFGQEPFSDEENAVAKKAFDHAYGQAVDHYQRAGKPVPKPAPGAEGPAPDIARPNFTEEDLKAGRKPTAGSVALLADKDGKKRLARFDPAKNKFVWIQ